MAGARFCIITVFPLFGLPDDNAMTKYTSVLLGLSYILAFQVVARSEVNLEIATRYMFSTSESRIKQTRAPHLGNEFTFADMTIDSGGTKILYRYWLPNHATGTPIPQNDLEGTATLERPILGMWCFFNKELWVTDYTSPAPNARASWQPLKEKVFNFADEQYVNISKSLPYHSFANYIQCSQFQREEVIKCIETRKDTQRVMDLKEIAATFPKFNDKIRKDDLVYGINLRETDSPDHPWQYLVVIDMHKHGIRLIYANYRDDINIKRNFWPYLFQYDFVMRRSEDQITVNPRIYETLFYHSNEQSIK